MLKSLIAAAAALALASPAAQAQDATTGYVQVENGPNVYYEMHGAGDPLVMLHGAYMAHRSMMTIAQPFTANRQVILIDLQGHGRTNDIERPFSYEAMADDVAAVFDGIGIETADVFGYSMGGSVALQLAIQHPEKVREVIAASAASSDRGYQPELAAMLPHLTPEMFEGSPPLTDYRELSPHPEKFPELMKKLVTLDQTPFDWTDDLARIEANTLLVFGDADVVTPEHQVEMFRALGGGVNGDMVPAMSKAQLAVMPGTTHLGVGFNPALLHTFVETFLSTDAKAPFPPAQ